jgi:uncharacterized membrane protein
VCDVTRIGRPGPHSGGRAPVRAARRADFERLPGVPRGYWSVMTAIGRGLVAGAFGDLLLNAATYVDMAMTGRPVDNAPGDTVQRVARRVGLDPPTDEPRLEAYGVLGGMATGLGLGVLVSTLRAAGVRLPAPLAGIAIGGLAMAASDAAMVANGVTDPRQWTAAEWTRDVVPHLAYGVGVRWAMDRIDASPPVEKSEDTPAPSRLGLVARSAALGLAAGGRSSLAVGGPLMSRRGRLSTLAAAGLVTTELVVDKSPAVPDRLAPGPLAGRLIGGGVGAAALARRHDSRAGGATVAAVIGVAGAFVGSLVGAAWREVAAERGWAGRAALAEDAVSLGLTVAACR